MHQAGTMRVLSALLCACAGMVVCARLCVRKGLCACMHFCVRVYECVLHFCRQRPSRMFCARACVCVRACVRVSVCVCVSMFAFVSVPVWHDCVYASALCRSSHHTAGTGGIDSSAGGAGGCVCVVAVRLSNRPGVARVGRRGHLDESHRRGGMGCASVPHVGGRRRRRDLRHRRPRQWRCRQPGCVGQHGRRCAGRTRSHGGHGVLGGYDGHAKGLLQGHIWGTQGYYKEYGVLNQVPKGYRRAL
jgi:hypothetical protein